MDKILKYFHGDELAATVWSKKYQIAGEEIPDDSFKRYVKEITDIELKRFTKMKQGIPLELLSELGKERYHNVYNITISREDVENYFLKYINFDNIILGGSMLQSIGNHKVYSILSNCFVLPAPYDSYAGIAQITDEMAQVMKRRAGAGFNLNSIRPNGADVHNQASYSSGPVLFANRFSNITLEVSQNGRRGALMLMMHINHPDSVQFAAEKQDLTKLTGANISIQISDEFMKAVNEGKDFIQRFPIDIPLDNFDSRVKFDELPYDVTTEVKYIDKSTDTLHNGYIRRINAKETWDKICTYARNTAEPGILFVDNWYNYGTDGVYKEYRAISTNPCSEIPMQAYDTCRLASINLFTFVVNPFTDAAYFDYERFKKVCYEQLCIMDAICDLEVEYINRIIDKIENSDDPIELKQREINLWRKVIETGQSGRRIGAGFTALGDCLAGLGLKYDSDKALLIVTHIFKTKMKAELDASIDMAILFGPFKGWDKSLEYTDNGVGRNKIFQTIRVEFREQYERMMKYGRRNVSWSTAAPTGSLSILAQTTSGIEPLFSPYYMRRKKVIDDKTERVDYVDPADGQKFTVFPVVHPKFASWMKIMKGVNDVTTLTESEIKEYFTESPWYQSCANDINWIKRVMMQSVVQHFTTHSISSTVNLPHDVSVEEVQNIYYESWNNNLKGITIYRDGARGGVLITSDTKSKKDDNFDETRAPKRPKRLPAVYHTIRAKRKVYSVIIGFYESKPYEVFIASGIDNLPENLDDYNDCIHGELVKEAKDWYNFESKTFILKEIPDIESEEKMVSLMISMALRHRTPLKFVIKTLEKTKPIAGTFTHKLIKVLGKYIPDGTESGEKCPECGQQLTYENGCKICKHCGWTKC